MSKILDQLYRLGLSLTLTAGSIAAVSGGPISAATSTLSKAISLDLNGSAVQSDDAPFLDTNGTVYVPLRLVSSMLKTVVIWNEAAKEVSIFAPEHTIQLKPGCQSARHNGRAIQLTAPSTMKNGRIYVPLRFIAQSLGAQVGWNASKRKASISYPEIYMMEIVQPSREASNTFWLNTLSGELYQYTSGAKAAVLTGKLNYEPHSIHYMNISIDSLQAGEFMVKVVDYYGEPMIHTVNNTAYIKNNKLLNQSSVEYFQRDSPNISSFKNRPILTDGKRLQMLDPKDGSVEKEFDLVKLGGYDELYSVEGMGDDYLLIRPNKTGMLTLVNPDTDRKKVLNELLNKEDQEFFNTNDLPYLGDWLVVKGEQDGIIHLEYPRYIDKKTDKLIVKVKDWL
ncbi:copper amine oxidase N-terminal domain-containing protein [Paenibacillus sp. YPG26]|uniref:copper amine oxidase N-terminal domain-containing protein n=1 Tax=Paenibacillus sp. YPG26 TaxID=2878915 RepID=UPI00203D0056|nr:copper amine oxidase N-terminal domain-containing protein [Paenibacillus sp. YPG26]USB33838.1 copper amine oxidase N-terminal domain-containing protein [Paenibacillus sp. YPG26]